jgi:hypothetical protein
MFDRITGLKHFDTRFQLRFLYNICNIYIAMDPASPNFESQNATVRVDKTDAKFVDVIHTNGDSIFTGSVGMFTAVGHVDFYPNGGKQQPGCPSMTNLIGGFFSSDPSANGMSIIGHISLKSSTIVYCALLLR